MKYEVMMTSQAVADLRTVFEYIAYELLAGQTALNQLDRLEKAIEGLEEMPERHHVYEKESWKSRNLRVMPVDNYILYRGKGRKTGNGNSHHVRETGYRDATESAYSRQGQRQVRRRRTSHGRMQNKLVWILK